MTGALNFALTWEYAQHALYQRALDTEGWVPHGVRDAIAQIWKQERAHAELLTRAILRAGGTPVEFAARDFDFTAGGALNPSGDGRLFLALAQAFEDGGVRAYKGVAASLSRASADFDAVLRIHTVEARHAAYVRRLRGVSGWLGATEPQGLPAGFGFNAIYAEGAPPPRNGAHGAFDPAHVMDALLCVIDPFVRESA